jgi:hypothetical protein
MIHIKYIITSIGLIGFLIGNPSDPKAEENRIGGITIKNEPPKMDI